MVEAVSVAAFGGDHITGFDRYVSRPLLRVVEALAGLLLVADLAVVSASVLYRYVLTAPLVWSDDVARALLLGVSFLGAATALARGENAGVSFFADRLSPGRRRFVDAAVAVVILAVTAGFCWNAIVLYQDTAGQTVGAGIPQEAFFLPMCIGAAAMVVFSAGHLLHLRRADVLAGAASVGAIAVIWYAWSTFAPTACRMRRG